MLNMKSIETILLLCVVCGSDAAVPEDTRAGHGDLVEAIKLNLRRNNDDYTDSPALKRQTASESSVPTTLPTYSKKTPLKGLRRAYNAVQNEMFDHNLMYELEENVIGQNSTYKYRKSKLANWKFTPLIASPKLNRMSTTNQPKETTRMRAISKANRSKIERFQKYFEKNKALFKEFLSSKMAAKTQFSRSVGRQRAQANTNGIPVKEITGHQRGWLDGEDSGTTEPLDPDRLDMVPAVGGRVHYWRLRGRLCHRHVLMPEGPKYDSKGRVYLPEHKRKDVHRPYNVTRRPHLLLPKCCNCCKKSVLGCE